MKEWIKTLRPKAQALDWDSLSPDQAFAIKTIVSQEYDLCVLTGRAGSGKSHVIGMVRDVCKAEAIKCYVVGVTGVASSNVGGNGTLNKFVGMGLTGSVLPDGVRDNLPANDRRRRRNVSTIVAGLRQSSSCPSGKAIVIIDEALMGSSEQLSIAIQCLMRTGGRKTFVLVGDARQLPPVDKQDNSLPYKTSAGFLFEKPVFTPVGGEEITLPSVLEGPPDADSNRQWRVKHLSLVVNHRQQEAGTFCDALDAMGDGRITSLEDILVRPLQERMFIRVEGSQYVRVSNRQQVLLGTAGIHLFSANKDASAHNEAVLAEFKRQGAQTRVYPATIEDHTWSRADILEYLKWVQPEQELAVGMRFMVRLNLSDTVSNGTVGTITKLLPDGIEVEVKGKPYKLDLKEIPLPTTATGAPVGVCKALPGHLAHGLTVHKSQGLTIPEEDVFVHLKSIVRRSPGWAYVACSRVKRAEQLHLLFDEGKLFNPWVAHPKVRAFLATVEKAVAKDIAELFPSSPSSPLPEVPSTEPEEEVPFTLEYLRRDGDCHILYDRQESVHYAVMPEVEDTVTGMAIYVILNNQWHELDAIDSEVLKQIKSVIPVEEF